MIEASGDRQEININKNLKIDNLRAVLRYNTLKDYMIIYNQKILEGHQTIKEVLQNKSIIKIIELVHDEKTNLHDKQIKRIIENRRM